MVWDAEAMRFLLLGLISCILQSSRRTPLPTTYYYSFSSTAFFLSCISVYRKHDNSFTFRIACVDFDVEQLQPTGRPNCFAHVAARVRRPPSPVISCIGQEKAEGWEV